MHIFKRSPIGLKVWCFYTLIAQDQNIRLCLQIYPKYSKGYVFIDFLNHTARTCSQMLIQTKQWCHQISINYTQMVSAHPHLKEAYGPRGSQDQLSSNQTGQVNLSKNQSLVWYQSTKKLHYGNDHILLLWLLSELSSPAFPPIKAHLKPLIFCQLTRHNGNITRIFYQLYEALRRRQ